MARLTSIGRANWPALKPRRLARKAGNMVAATPTVGASKMFAITRPRGRVSAMTAYPTAHQKTINARVAAKAIN
jgi:hypothetical protein